MSSSSKSGSSEHQAGSPPEGDPPPQSGSCDECEVQSLARALCRALERCREGCGHDHEGCGHQDRGLSTDTMADLLVLLTAVRTLESNPPQPVPTRSRVDAIVEDMCDPEFGLRPARKIITQAAEHILHGYEALRFPRHDRRPGERDDDD